MLPWSRGAGSTSVQHHALLCMVTWNSANADPAFKVDKAVRIPHANLGESLPPSKGMLSQDATDNLHGMKNAHRNLLGCAIV